MIGGMSWESTLDYYRLINEAVKNELGSLHSAKILMYSVDFAGIEKLQHENRWGELTDVMTGIAGRLEAGGADLLMICTNTMHLMAEEVQAAVDIPLIHIADTAAAEIKRLEFTKVGLLGTRFTMEQDFYKGRLKDRWGIDVVIPGENDMQFVHDVIYNELCLGQFKPESRARFIDITGGLASSGAQGVVLGCTEIPLLLKNADTDIPLFNTMELHAGAAVREALNLI